MPIYLDKHEPLSLFKALVETCTIKTMSLEETLCCECGKFGIGKYKGKVYCVQHLFEAVKGIVRNAHSKP